MERKSWKAAAEKLLVQHYTESEWIQFTREFTVLSVIARLRTYAPLFQLAEEILYFGLR